MFHIPSLSGFMLSNRRISYTSKLNAMDSDKGQTHTKKANTPNTYGCCPFSLATNLTLFVFFSSFFCCWLFLLMLFLCIHTFLEWCCFAFSPSCLFYNIYPICLNASSIYSYIFSVVYIVLSLESMCFMLLVDRLLLLPPSSSLSFPFAFKFDLCVSLLSLQWAGLVLQLFISLLCAIIVFFLPFTRNRFPYTASALTKEEPLFASSPCSIQSQICAIPIPQLWSTRAWISMLLLTISIENGLLEIMTDLNPSQRP